MLSFTIHGGGIVPRGCPRPRSGGSTSHLLRSASNDDKVMTDEESREYDRILEERRRKKKEQTELYKRRANFDPMARRKASSQHTDDMSIGVKMPPVPPPIPMRPPPRQPRLANASQTNEEPEELDEDDGDEDEDEDGIDDAAFERAALAFLEKEKKASSQLPPPSPAQGRRVTVAPGSYKRPSATPLDSLNAPRPPSITPVIRKKVSQPTPSRRRSLQTDKLRRIVEDEEEGDEAEELDWDTLKAGESFEKYLSSLEKEEEGLKIQRKRAEAARTRASSPAATGSKIKEAKVVQNDDIGSELEELLKLVEMVGEEEGEEAGPGLSSPIKSASTTAAAKGGRGKDEHADDIDWTKLEKMFLGDGWDTEIKELAEKALAAEDEASSLSSSSSSSQEPLSPPWADEVTTLLLGLVSISHERYLNKPLFDQEVGEEERAEVFFNAPFALLVHDNSQEAMLEYANLKALKMIGCSFEDIYSLSSFDVVDQADSQQQDWLWATSEVEEKEDKFTSIPQITFRQGAVAKNVLVFRLDNLEGEAMGQAILIRD